MRRRMALLAVASLALVPAGADAQSRTLGSPLAQPPNVGMGCETEPVYTQQSTQFGFYEFHQTGHADCTWFQSGVVGSTNYSDPRTGSVPADGTLTNVAVRSGPSPAPVRIVILRQFGNGQTTGCCAFQGETQPFQLTPNAITNIPLSIPVERNIRGFNAVADYVGISSRSGLGTLPLLDTGDNNLLSGYHVGAPDAGFLYPALGRLPGEVPGGGSRNPRSIPNFELLVQWTWTPPGVTPTPPTNPGVPGAARNAAVANGRALVDLICQGDAACAGQLSLLTGGLGKRLAKQRIIGKSDYSLTPGSEKTVKVKLNKRGKALLKRKKSAKVTLSIAPAGGTPVTQILKLKR